MSRVQQHRSNIIVLKFGQEISVAVVVVEECYLKFCPSYQITTTQITTVIYVWSVLF